MQTQTPSPIKREAVDGVAYEIYLNGETATFRIFDLDAGQALPMTVSGPLAVVEARWAEAVKNAKEAA